MPEKKRDWSRRHWLAVGAAFVLAVAATTAAAATTAGTHTKSAHALVNLRATSLGKVLVDARGRTLYMYTLDRNRKSACYTGCAGFWPPLLSKTAHPTFANGVRKVLLGTTKRKDGKLQVTYRKHPLYTFAGDSKAGAVAGQGYQKRWYVLSASGAVIRKSATASTTSTTGGGTTTTGGGDAWG